MNRNVLAAVSVMLLFFSAPAQADIEFTNDTQYFQVQGKTPAELYASILSHSMKIGGKRTIASISTRLSQSGKARETGSSCKANDDIIKLNFAVHRPRAANEELMPPEDRKNREQMYAFIRSHEELHRQIQLHCAEALTNDVAAIEEQSCRAVTNKTNLLWPKMITECDSKQKSFDDEQTGMLLGHQFFIDAMHGRATQQTA